MPLETWTETYYRNANRFAAAEKTKKQRETVAKALDDKLPRCAMFLGDWKTGNRFLVTMTRISPLFLDNDNVQGSLKAVQDEIADWIGFRDDRHPWIRFKHMQQQCKHGFQGIRIMIQCNEPGNDVRHMMAPYPELVGEALEYVQRKEKPQVSATAEPERKKPVQETLTFIPSYAALPWNHIGDDEYELELLTKLGNDPPTVITFRRKGTAERVTLERRRFHHPNLGECWLYGPRARDKEAPSVRY